ncbi:MAG: aminotransferase class V-fold PLP-dependent enzyme [Cyclobacteriaceae bacterium]|nr:aminotransferase class V-fold PLP-dependent enzyme [Cyclobacteriaceae bacterium]
MLNSKRAQFTLPPQVSYLNCAYMSPLLKSVEKVGVKALRKKRNPVSISQQDFFTDTELLRKEYARLIHATNLKQIVIIPSVSYGMANVVRNMDIKKGQHIIVATEQFPSNYYPWKSLCDEAGAEIKAIAPPEDFDERGKRWNQRILEAIDSNTKAVAIGNVHWADGTRFDLEAIRKRTQDVGALLIVDGTQSVGALPFDVQKIKPDALVCAGYKWLLGPYSIGLAYYGEYFNNGKPIEENWITRLNSEDFAGLVNYKNAYHEGALRYEVGERSNFILVPMLLKAIQQLNNWGPERIQEYCREIGKNTIEKLMDMGFLIEKEEWRGSHLFGIRLPASTDLEKIKQSLFKHNVYLSFRGNAIRVAPNVYNTEKDFQKLFKALTKFY